MKLTLVLGIFLLLVAITQASPAYFTKRRFQQEHTSKADATYQAVRDIAQGTNKEEQAGNLSGAMVRALIAKAPVCDQQDRADEIIDLGISLGGKRKQKLIKVAKTYRRLERNTPKAGQPSALCKKPPRHKELKGITQAQDPTGKKDKDKGGKGGKGKKGKGGKNKAETNPVGGVKMPKIVRKNNDFFVKGNGFNGDVNAAHNRQCDVQHNLCFDKFNSGDRSFSGQDCENQNAVCKAGPPVFAN